MKQHNKADIYTRITDRIVADLEQGVRPWLKPWNAAHAAGRITRPLRHNGIPYRGINTLMLWSAAMEAGYAAPIWITFKQAQELGAHVRKGEKGSLVVYANTITRTELDVDTGDEAEREIPFLKGYTVFNVEQVEGLPAQFYAPANPRLDPVQRIDHAETFFASTGADIHHGGNRAYYSVTDDHVQMPPFETFRDAESYYATLAHECTHNAVIRIVPVSASVSRKCSPPAHRCRHNQRDARKIPDRSLAAHTGNKQAETNLVESLN